MENPELAALAKAGSWVGLVCIIGDCSKCKGIVNYSLFILKREDNFNLRTLGKIKERASASEKQVDREHKAESTVLLRTGKGANRVRNGDVQGRRWVEDRLKMSQDETQATNKRFCTCRTILRERLIPNNDLVDRKARGSSKREIGRNRNGEAPRNGSSDVAG